MMTIHGKGDNDSSSSSAFSDLESNNIHCSKDDEAIKSLCGQMRLKNYNEKRISWNSKRKSLFSLRSPQVPAPNPLGIDGKDARNNGDYWRETIKLQQQQMNEKGENGEEEKNEGKEFDENLEDFSTNEKGFHSPRGLSGEETFLEMGMSSCRVNLVEGSTLILLRDDFDDHIHSCPLKTKNVFRSTMEIQNNSPYLYRFKILCNFAALQNFFVMPRSGAVSPLGTLPVTIQTKQEWKAEEEGEPNECQFEIKFFSVNSSGQQLEMEYQKIRKIIFWDPEDYLWRKVLLQEEEEEEELEECLASTILSSLSKYKKLFSSASSILSPSSQKKLQKLDQIYAAKILPLIARKRKIHNVRMQMLCTNQLLRKSIKTINFLHNGLLFVFFFMIYGVAFSFLLPIFQGKSLPADKLPSEDDENWFYENWWKAFSKMFLN